jgi:hypothetical protein
MNTVSTGRESPGMDVVEDFMTALIERNLYKGITGYRKRPEDGQAVSMARDYLNNHEQAIFDQIWYTNLVTLPVRIWPHNTGQLR